MPVLPARDPRDIGPKSGVKQFSVTLPEWLSEKLEEIGAAEGYTRNEVIREVMRSFADEWDQKHTATSRKQSK